MESNELQQAFFQQIRSKLPGHLSFVDEVAELLNISNDSAYRRIRGEKGISLEEIGKLAAHYNLSVDQVLKLKMEGGTFTGKYITAENFDFEKYLEQMLAELKFIASFKQKELIFFSKDIPVFHYYAFPELAAFKYFFWMKTLLQFQPLANSLFSFDLLIKPLVEIGGKVVAAYNSIPGTEIMNIENVNTTLRQIEYCKETYLFHSTKDIEIIFSRLHEMTDHIQKQAEAALKFSPGQQPNSQSAEYKVYVNDFIIGDNSNLVTLDGNKVSYLTHSQINFILIHNPAFTEYNSNFIHNVIKKSILISDVDEKYRARFFYLMHDRIEQCRNNKMQTIGKL